MRLNLALTLAGVLAVAAGCWLIYLPAGLIAGGLGLTGFGLLRDDGSKS